MAKAFVGLGIALVAITLSGCGGRSEKAAAPIDATNQTASAINASGPADTMTNAADGNMTARNSIATNDENVTDHGVTDHGVTDH